MFFSAASSMLDYIVVDDVAGCQQCLEYLKEQKLGRANFIALDKVSYCSQ